VFFFQAEDGIRDFHVTGVQTCALPISDANGYADATVTFDRVPDDTPDVPVNIVAEYSGVEGNIEPSQDTIELTLTPKPVVQWNRSEERRVGKEGRSRG